jgi:hypothetical protein
MKSVLQILRASAVMTVVLALGLPLPAAWTSPVGRCPLNQPNCRPTLPPIPPIRISTEYAKHYVIERMGADVAAHMRYRVEEPVGGSRIEKNPNLSRGPFTSFTSTYSTAWSGYYSDLSGTSYRATDAHAWFNVATQTSGSLLSTWVGIGGGEWSIPFSPDPDWGRSPQPAASVV